MTEINSFRGDNYFLSNMYPCEVVYHGILFQCSESAFQAAKCLDRAVEFASLEGRPAKRHGRKVALRKDWDAVKVDVMREIVAAKFHQNPDLMEKLKQTGNARLVEGNTWNDTYWGVCDGHGKNWLGRILMELRDGKPAPDASVQDVETMLTSLEAKWAARTGDSITVSSRLDLRPLTLRMPLGNEKKTGTFGSAPWVVVSGADVSNALEGPPADLARNLANYGKVSAEHDADLKKCLDFARRHAASTLDTPAYSFYSDWYKSLTGERPEDWDTLEKRLTGTDR